MTEKELDVRTTSPDGEESAVRKIPDEVLESVEREIEDAGGEWKEPPEYEGSIARTMFDTTGSDDGTVTVLMPKDKIELLPRQSFVRIKSSDGRSYLGALVKGPFAEPDGLRADAPILVAVTVRGGLLMPKYHGRAQVELMAEELGDGFHVPPRRRPVPNSPVWLLDSSETASVLRTEGDIQLGVVDGHEDIELKVPSGSKNVLPRHVGVLGTTGGGKSTTVSGLLGQVQSAGIASVFIDTEGEYTSVCDPTDDPHMLKALKRRGMSPEGIDDTHVYVLVGREPSNPNHPRVQEFSLRFSELSPYAVMEILGLTDAQQERFIKAYDITKLLLERLKIFPKTTEDRNRLLDLDELEEGYPQMKLSDLYDVVNQIAAIHSDSDDPYLENKAFMSKRDELKKLIHSSNPPKSIPSWRALQGRLGRVKRYKIFDNPDAEFLSYKEMLTPGRVSIIDLGDVDSPQINNLVIAQLLRGVHEQQDQSYKAATAAGKRATPVMVFVEEAHEFLSAERIRQMPVLFQQVARIARRGRKRWLGLVFITQLPQHLPDEVLGLINNWVMHKISDSNVVNRLRKSIGGIDQSLWSVLTSLAPGQAVVSFTSMARPVLVAIDPTPSKLLMVE